MTFDTRKTSNSNVIYLTLSPKSERWDDRSFGPLDADVRSASRAL